MRGWKKRATRQRNLWKIGLFHRKAWGILERFVRLSAWKKAGEHLPLTLTRIRTRCYYEEKDPRQQGGKGQALWLLHQKSHAQSPARQRPSSLNCLLPHWEKGYTISSYWSMLTESSPIP